MCVYLPYHALHGFLVYYFTMPISSVEMSGTVTVNILMTSVVNVILYANM